MSLDANISINVGFSGGSVGKQQFGIPLLLVEPAVGDYAIATVTKTTKTITITAEVDDYFKDGQSFRIYGSTDNDGAYTVNGDATYLAPTTTIIVDQTPGADSGADGALCMCFGSELYKEYSSPSEVEDDEAYFGTSTDTAFINGGFGGARRPKKIAIGVLGTGHANPYEALTDIFKRYKDFWGVACKTRNDAYIVSASPDTSSVAAWVETNKKFSVGQSDNVDCKGVAYDPTNTDPMGMAKAQSRVRTTVIYHPTDGDYLDWQWLCNRVSVDPDKLASIWTYVTISGVTTQIYQTTEQSIMDGKNGSYYTTFGGVGATANGLTADGTHIDVLLAADWVKARMEEALKQVLLDVVALGQKIPYTETGIQVFGDVTLGVLKRGEAIGHFEDESSAVIMPDYDDISATTKATRVLTFEWGTRPSGAIEGADIEGVVTLDFNAPTA